VIESLYTHTLQLTLIADIGVVPVSKTGKLCHTLNVSCHMNEACRTHERVMLYKRLQLKLIADVGVIGVPNAVKSCYIINASCHMNEARRTYTHINESCHTRTCG